MFVQVGTEGVIVVFSLKRFKEVKLGVICGLSARLDKTSSN
jgi:hypothetical protein